MRTEFLPNHRDSFSASAAQDYCDRLTAAHYENFPVASFLLPAELRPAVRAIYAFARTADDIADEAEHEGQRLERLRAWEEMLERCFAGEAEHPVFIALRGAILRFDLPRQPFFDLLAAFRMDVTKTRHGDFESLHRYCMLSADPVGRLVLHLFGYRDVELWPFSDAICTALQLTNHWQDVGSDLERGRIYIPREDMVRHGVEETALFEKRVDAPFRALMSEEVERARTFFRRGWPLCERVKGRLRAEIRLTWQGGWRVLELIERAGFDVFRRRPRLDALDAMPIAWRALVGRGSVALPDIR